MFRLATTYLLIAVVLICPYLCLGEAAYGAGVSSHECGCCCDEQQDQDSSHDQTPESPTERDEDCLCHGAIFGASRTAADELTAPAAMSMHWVQEIASSTTNLSLAAVSFESPHQFPPFSTGRDVCALTCTLQL